MTTQTPTPTPVFDPQLEQRIDELSTLWRNMFALHQTLFAAANVFAFMPLPPTGNPQVDDQIAKTREEIKASQWDNMLKFTRAMDAVQLQKANLINSRQANEPAADNKTHNTDGGTQ